MTGSGKATVREDVCRPPYPAGSQTRSFTRSFRTRFARSARLAKPDTLEAWGSPPSVFGFQGGDLFGVAEHLDYLSDLGISALYLNPIFSSAANHRYHTYDYFTVDPLLGGTPAFRELLDQAHARDIRVVLDGVFHHAGRGLWQFSPYPGERRGPRRMWTGSTSTWSV